LLPSTGIAGRKRNLERSMADALYVDKDAEPDALVGRVLNKLCRAFAVGSGVTLILMSLMSLTSIVGRSLFSKPILGDYELVQMMSAVAVTMALALLPDDPRPHHRRFLHHRRAEEVQQAPATSSPA
jgi:hypothetical protein